MNILIVGSNGFLGSHCAKHFRSEGHLVWTAERTGGKQSHHFVLRPADANYQQLFERQDYDVCINASGSASVSHSFEDPADDFAANVVIVHRLLEAMRVCRSRCSFLNFSSAAVYGNPLKLPVRESARLSPVSPYGFHKLQSEILLRQYHTLFGLRTCSLRIFSAYGPGLRKQLFWDVYQRCKKDRHLELHGTGKETRDFIFVDDLVKALDVILRNGKFQGEAVNIASGQETTIQQAVETFFELLDVGLTYRFSGATKIGDPTNWRASICTISQMGFAPSTSLKDGLVQYTQWLNHRQ